MDFVTASRSCAQPSFGAACEAFPKGLVRRNATKSVESASGKLGVGKVRDSLDSLFLNVIAFVERQMGIRTAIIGIEGAAYLLRGSVGRG